VNSLWMPDANGLYRDGRGRVCHRLTDVDYETKTAYCHACRQRVRVHSKGAYDPNRQKLRCVGSQLTHKGDPR
jgi:hypothetical protein